MEKWVVIEEFPNYCVSTEGRVSNFKTDRLLKTSKNRGGVVKVGLLKDGIQQTRSVASLVANAFVQGKTDSFNTPIHLDGDESNNNVDNLAWRPRWFACQYARQFTDPHRLKNKGPIQEVESKAVFVTLFEAATKHGVLFEDVWRSMTTGRAVFPDGRVYKLLK